MDSNIDKEVIPQDILDSAMEVMDFALPDKSKHMYDEFLSWMIQKGTLSNSEVVLLAYFKELSSNHLPSTLWSKYSMIRTMLKLRKNVDIAQYGNLRQYLRRINTGFKPKKARVLSPEDVKKFINDAPNVDFLVIKVAMILGITGGLRRMELFNLKIDDVEDKTSYLIVKIPKTKTNIERTFTVYEQCPAVIMKYLRLRPTNLDTDKFFLNYHNGRCTRQSIVINKIGGFPADIASWLKLPNPNEYTGHSFRRTSATILADSGASITTLKRHGGWKSTHVAEGYVENGINNKRKICDQITKSIKSSSINSNSSNDSMPITSAGAPTAKVLKLDLKGITGQSTTSSSVQLQIENCDVQ